MIARGKALRKNLKLIEAVEALINEHCDLSPRDAPVKKC